MQVACHATAAKTRKASESAVDLAIYGLHTDELGQLAALGLDDALAKRIAAMAKAEGFVGAAKQQLVLRMGVLEAGNRGPQRIALVGLGKREAMRAVQWLQVAGTMTRLGKSVRAKRFSVHLSKCLLAPQPPLSEALLIAQGLQLGSYRFDACRAAAKAEDGSVVAAPQHVQLCVQQAHLDDMSEAVKIGETVAAAVVQARDWVNLPANLLGPQELTDAARAQAKALGLRVRVLDETALKAQNMGLLLGVGQGSQRPPRLVHLTYEGGSSKGGDNIVLIGKGIVFDSGGLSLKPPDGMVTMKMDMGGAAAVLATICAVARLQLPIRVHAVLAIAENMPSGHAIRPGDVLTSASGKTIEVNNTDAEGRLVLADAIHYAKGLQPSAMVDVATLTGACMVALGPKTAGLFSNDETVAEGLRCAADDAGEHVWRMPLTAGLRDQLKSDCADMRNTGERYGGAITAALFLKEFVGETPWGHLDIAGPAWGSEEGGHLSKGGTGMACATLIRWLMRLASAGATEPAAAANDASDAATPASKSRSPRARGRSRGPRAR